MKITKENIFSASSTAFTILLIALSLCMLFAGENLLFKLLPILLFVFGAVISVLWDKIKPLKDKKKVKLAFMIFLAAVAVFII